MVRGSDYVDGGWFGESAHPAPTEYFYLVTARKGNAETAYYEAQVVSRDTAAGQINRITWRPVNGATGYRVYRFRAEHGAGRLPAAQIGRCGRERLCGRRAWTSPAPSSRAPRTTAI